jgi:hypothetical protein
VGGYGEIENEIDNLITSVEESGGRMMPNGSAGCDPPYAHARMMTGDPPRHQQTPAHTGLGLCVPVPVPVSVPSLQQALMQQGSRPPCSHGGIMHVQASGMQQLPLSRDLLMYRWTSHAEDERGEVDKEIDLGASE